MSHNPLASPFNNLPTPSHVRLIGRNTKRHDIQQRLEADSYRNAIVIAGEEGVGKTALALDVAWSYVTRHDAGPFRAIIWVPVIERQSVSTEPFQPFDLVAHKAVSPTLYRILLALADAFHARFILRAAPRNQDRVAIHLLQTSGRVLLIVDDYDATDDLDVRTFLVEHLPSSCKVILTTRNAEGLPDPIELPPLGPRALDDLLLAQSPQGMDVREVLSHIRDATPLIALVASGLSMLKGGDDVREWALQPDKVWPRKELRRSDQLHDLIHEIVTGLYQLALDAYLVLRALTFFDPVRGATAEELSIVAGIGRGTRDEALAKLVQLHLIVPMTSASAPLASYTFAHNSMWIVARTEARMRPEPDWEVAARHRWLSYYHLVTETLTSQVARLRYAAERDHLDNILTVMEWLGEQHEIDELAWFFERTQDALRTLGLWDPLLSFADQLSIWSEDRRDADRAKLPLQAAMDVCARREAIQQGETWLKRAEIVARHTADALLTAEIALARARLYCSGGKYSTKLKPHGNNADYLYGIDTALRHALTIFAERDLPDKSIQSLQMLGHFYRSQAEGDDLRRAEDAYSRALELLDRTERAIPNRIAWRSDLRGNLAIVAGRQGNYAAACQTLREIITQRGESNGEDFTDEVDRAQIYAALAYYYARLGQWQEAQNYRAEADTLRDRLCLAEDEGLGREDEAWATLHRTDP